MSHLHSLSQMYSSKTRISPMRDTQDLYSRADPRKERSQDWAQEEAGPCRNPALRSHRHWFSLKQGCVCVQVLGIWKTGQTEKQGNYRS